MAVLNPAVLVAYRKSKNLRRKTDKQDALLLAWYGQDNEARLRRTLWHPFAQPVLALRYLLNYRQDLLGMLHQENNRLHAGRFTAWTWTQVLLHSVQVKRLLHAAERHLLAHIKAHEDLHSLWLRLQTIPGIGEVTAAALIAYIGDITRFRRVGALVSLAGLALRQQESGSSVYEPARIDRHGHSELRRLLYWCAISAMRTDPTIAA